MFKITFQILLYYKKYKLAIQYYLYENISLLFPYQILVLYIKVMCKTDHEKLKLIIMKITV